jgi:hypothetical protein
MLKEIKKINTDFEVDSLDIGYENDPQSQQPWWYNLKYLVAGIFFGIILVKEKLFPGSGYRKCFACKVFLCMGL